MCVLSDSLCHKTIRPENDWAYWQILKYCWNGILLTWIKISGLTDCSCCNTKIYLKFNRLWKHFFILAETWNSLVVFFSPHDKSQTITLLVNFSNILSLPCITYVFILILSYWFFRRLIKMLATIWQFSQQISSKWRIFG